QYPGERASNDTYRHKLNARGEWCRTKRIRMRTKRRIRHPLHRDFSASFIFQLFLPLLTKDPKASAARLCGPAYLTYFDMTIAEVAVLVVPAAYFSLKQ